MDDAGPRQRLLEAAAKYVVEHGFGDLSLRALAQKLGTSHRMLIFHFESKDKLWSEIVHAIEQEQRRRLGQLLPDPSQAPREMMWAWWKHISDPSLWPAERLFFELYGQALQGRDHGTGFLNGIIDDWVAPIAQVDIAAGLPDRVAHARARLGVAVIRGLLLDLLATRDIQRVDDAMTTFIDLYGAWTKQDAHGETL